MPKTTVTTAVKTCQTYFDSCFLALTQGTFLLALITEISHVISDDLGPYVQELLYHTGKMATHFNNTLHCDETVIAQIQTQLDLLQPWIMRGWIK